MSQTLLARATADIAGKSLGVNIVDEQGKNNFVLDLATPEYRVVDLPISGPNAKITITADGSAQIADCSLWKFEWPSGNLAYIRPAGGKVAVVEKPEAEGIDDLFDRADNKTQSAGKIKDVKLYCPNSDIDHVAGPYLRIPLDPTQMVDGRRFESGKLVPWAANSNYFPTKGAFFTVDFGATTPLSLVATYDRAEKQSDLCDRLVVFTAEEVDEATSGKVLQGVTLNDQYWRLFDVPKTSLRVLGVHVFAGPARKVGLSEVEAYR